MLYDVVVQVQYRYKVRWLFERSVGWPICPKAVVKMCGEVRLVRDQVKSTGRLVYDWSARS